MKSIFTILAILALALCAVNGHFLSDEPRALGQKEGNGDLLTEMARRCRADLEKEHLSEEQCQSFEKMATDSSSFVRDDFWECYYDCLALGTYTAQECWIICS
mmetsp:Transcript_12033/g.13176  ORF Transcript_12033/g.13176 Transcript_12033/m.13176 type:complete len:103 (+) Transcript_12033:70-378(+)